MTVDGDYRSELITHNQDLIHSPFISLEVYLSVYKSQGVSNHRQFASSVLVNSSNCNYHNIDIVKISLRLQIQRYSPLCQGVSLVA